MRVASNGMSRTVVLIGRYAFKFPWGSFPGSHWRMFLRGLLANMNEARIWSVTRSPLICPIIWSAPGGFLIVARRCEAVSNEEFHGLDTAAWDRWPVERNKADSFGWLGGRLVAIDYGD